MSESNGSTMATYLREHPRMTGALFTIFLLLTQAQPVLAQSSCAGCDGP